MLKNQSNQFDARGDQLFGASDSLFGRVSYVSNPQFIPGPFPESPMADHSLRATRPQNRGTPLSAQTHTFSPSLLNEARFGFNRISTTRVQPNDSTMGIPAQFGIQGIPQVPYNGGLGSLFISGLSTLGSNQYLPSVEYSNTYQFTDNVTKNLGRHSIKVGFEFQYLQFSILQPPSGRGAWNFSGDYTEVPTTNGGNTGLAQMLLTPIPATVAGAADYVGGADNIQASNIANTDITENTSVRISKTTSR